MDNKIDYFLVLAKELNISRAAKKLYTSQQNLSAYLKNLEEEYGVALFNRKPRLGLTIAGEVLLRTYQQMKMLENNLHMELLQISDGTKGHLEVGIHSSRSSIIVPEILSSYWEKYPNVTVNLVDGLTNYFEEELLAGRLDFFIGVDPFAHPSFEMVPLMDESVSIVISDALLQKYFGENWTDCKERFAKGVDLREFEHVPFILNEDDSRISIILSNYLEQNQIRITPRVKSNNAILRIELSAKNYGACICTSMRLKSVYDFNAAHPDIPALNVYPINDLNYKCRTFLVFHRDIYQPQYIEYFYKTVERAFSKLF